MKRIFTFITILAAAVMLVACGGDRNNNRGEKLVEWYELSKDADYDGSKVTVKFWHRMGANNQAIVQKWIKEFNEIYPNITIDEVKVADNYDQLAEKISLSITSGNVPHIAESYPDHIARYAQGNAPLALNNFISNPNIGYTEEEIKDFLSGLWAEGSSYDRAGTILSLPFTKSSEALFYNKAYFDEKGYEVPTTWEELFALAETIKKDEPDAIPFGYDSEPNLFITASEQLGIPYTGYNEKTGKGEVLFNNDESKEMAKYFHDKVSRGLMLTRALNSNAYTSDIMKTGEKLYMYVGSTGGAQYSYATDEKGEAVFEKGYRVGVAPVPTFEGKARRQIQQGPNINLFRKSNEQEMIAAWLFAKFMLEAERTAEFALASGYAPIRHSAYQTDTWKNYVAGIKENPANIKEATAKVIKEAIELFRDNEEIFFTSAVFNTSSKTRIEVGNMLVKILAYNGNDLDTFINKEYKDTYEFIVN